MVIVAGLLFTGCFAKVLIIVLYAIFMEDSTRVANTNSELIKQIKLRYSNQIKLELPIKDAEKYVSRYIYQYSKLIKFINVADMMGLIAMLGGIILNYDKKFFGIDVLLIAMFVYVGTGLLVDGYKKEKIIIDNIADYLANNMNTRMAAKEHRVLIKESLLEELEQMESEKPVFEAQGEAVQEKAAKLIRKNTSLEENAIIEEVLREFLQV